MIRVEVHEPQLRLVGTRMYVRFAGGSADMSRLRFSGNGVMWSTGGNSGIPGCHQHGASRVTSGGNA